MTLGKRFVQLERVVRRAPLGLRFVEHPTGQPVLTGLRVTAWQLGAERPRFSAKQSPQSGIYGFTSLPGLRDYETAVLPASNWCSDPDADTNTPNFVVEVEDTQGRYLPSVHTYCLPKTQVITIELHPQPSAVPPPSFATVYGEVFVVSADAPAAWAQVEARDAAGGTWQTTVANERGLFALFVPLPRPEDAPAFGTKPLGALNWPFRFRVRYGAQTVPAGTTIPTAASIAAQPLRDVFADVSNSDGQPRITRRVQAGDSLILQTKGASRLLLDD